MDACKRLCVSAGSMCRKSGMHCTLFNFQHYLWLENPWFQPSVQGSAWNNPSHCLSCSPGPECVPLRASHVLQRGGCREISKNLKKHLVSRGIRKDLGPEGARDAHHEGLSAQKSPMAMFLPCNVHFLPGWPGSKKGDFWRRALF